MLFDPPEFHAPRVHNKHHNTAPPEAIYIGRGSKWGNQFVIGKDGDRAQVIAKHRTWVLQNPALVEAVKRELAGAHLVCFCKPQACHGDFLFELANGLNR